MSDADTENSRPMEVIIGDEDSAGEQTAVRNDEEPRDSSKAAQVITRLTEHLLLKKEDWEYIKKETDVMESNLQKMKSLKRKLVEGKAQSKQPTAAVEDTAMPKEHAIEPPVETPVPADKEVKREYVGMGEYELDPQAIAAIEADCQAPPAKKIKVESEEVETAPEATADVQDTTMPEEHAIETPVETPVPADTEVKKEYVGMGEYELDAQAIAAIEADCQTHSSTPSLAAPPSGPPDASQPHEKAHTESQPVTKVCDAMKDHDYAEVKKEPQSESESESESESATRDGYDSDSTVATTAPTLSAEDAMSEKISLWIVEYLTTAGYLGDRNLSDFIDSPLPVELAKMMQMVSHMGSVFKRDRFFWRTPEAMQQIKDHLTLLKQWVLDGGYTKKTPYFDSIQKVAEAMAKERETRGQQQSQQSLNQGRNVEGSAPKPAEKEIKEEVPENEGNQ